MMHQHALTVVYDGDCQLCVNSMHTIVNHFGDAVTAVNFRRIESLQSIHPDLNEEACRARMHVVQGGQVFSGARAFVQILKLHPVGKYVAPIYFVPPIGLLSERVYDYVARHRQQISKWFGRDVSCGDHCQIHSPKRK